MHACGHDAHVAVGIGVATILARHRDQIGGTVKLMFQPAEENLGGAFAMIADGLLETPKPDVALSIHVSSGHDTGTAVVREGPLMAASDGFQIVVRGRGGHGASPHETIDAVLVGTQIVVALQTIVSRNVDPNETGVVTVGAFHAGTVGNIIAETAELRGTIRSFTPDVRELLHRRVREVAEGVAASLGATAEVKLMIGVSPTVNEPQVTAVMREATAAVIGADRIDSNYRTTGAEDFSAVLEQIPGSYFFLGSRGGEASAFPHHNPRFDIDENCLPQGVAILCDTAVRCLRSA
jgi:amidohydrolase